MKPTEAPNTQPYGTFPQASGQPWIHVGDDYGCYRGQDVVTIAPGRVLFAGLSENVPNALADRIMLYRGSTASGRCVIVEHDGWIETFNHLEFLTVKTGDTLFRGQRVGGAGDSGNAFGVHLHHECIDIANVTATAPFGRYNPAHQIAYEDAVALPSIVAPTKDSPVKNNSEILIHPIQAESIVQETVNRMMQALRDNPPLINAVQAESIVQQSVERTVERLKS